MAQEELTTLPVGRLGLVPLESCRSLGQKVDEWLVKWRKEREHSESDSFAFEGYKRDSYTIKVQNPRFGSGEPGRASARCGPGLRKAWGSRC